MEGSKTFILIKCYLIFKSIVEGTEKGKGRPKITLFEIIKKDMSIKKVMRSMTSYRIVWRKRIHAADPS